MRAMSKVCIVLLCTSMLGGQAPAGKKEYLGELAYAVQQVNQLAEAEPEAKYSWRPSAAVRSMSEVYVHIAAGNFLLLGLIGEKPPADLYPADLPTSARDRGIAMGTINLRLEKKIAGKAEVTALLKRSFDAVKASYEHASAADLDKPVDFFGTPSTVRGIYLRILVHINEHMGQSVAYARMNGIVPPWSR